MRKIYYIISISLLSLNSCDSSHNDKTIIKADSSLIDSAKEADLIPETTKVINPEHSAEKTAQQQFSKTIEIVYQSNKDILKVLPLLPDSTMGSWEWTKKERQEFVQSVQANDQFIDTTANYNNIQQVKPHYFLTQVVDGVWSVTLYEIKKNHFIVITDDIVGDGNDIMAFDWENGSLAPIPLENLLGRNYPELLLSSASNACKDLLEENAMLSYNLDVINKLTISSPMLNKKDHGSCCKGNTMYFTFNPKLKKFDLYKITWE